MSATHTTTLGVVALLGSACATTHADAVRAPHDATAVVRAAPGFDYPIRHAQIHGQSMAYVDVGEGPPVVLLHGIPTRGFMWRNVIPELLPGHRVIVPDLMGYGRSYAGPALSYEPRAQVEYLAGFLDGLDLRDATLVVTDLGAVLGLHWAMRHEDRLRGIVAFEAPVLRGEEFWRSLPLSMRMMFGIMRDPKRAEKYVVRRNIMVEMMLAKMGTVRRLDDAALAEYRAALADEDTRRRVLLPFGPAAMPAKGRSRDPWDPPGIMDGYATWLAASKVPKLLLHARPGMLIGPATARRIGREFANTTLVDVGRGRHFLAEDQPAAIGRAIATFAASHARTR